jgi:hypothetical protein
MALLILLWLFGLAGCTCVWTKDIFYISVLKNMEVNKAVLTDRGSYLEKATGGQDPNTIHELVPAVTGVTGYIIGGL